MEDKYPLRTMFTATSLFDIPFSSFKALQFLTNDWFVRFRLTGAIFRKKISDEYNNLSNYGRNVMTKVRDNEKEIIQRS